MVSRHIDSRTTSESTLENSVRYLGQVISLSLYRNNGRLYVDQRLYPSGQRQLLDRPSVREEIQRDFAAPAYSEIQNWLASEQRDSLRIGHTRDLHAGVIVTDREGNVPFIGKTLGDREIGFDTVAGCPGDENENLNETAGREAFGEEMVMIWDGKLLLPRRNRNTIVGKLIQNLDEIHRYDGVWIPPVVDEAVQLAVDEPDSILSLEEISPNSPSVVHQKLAPWYAHVRVMSPTGEIIFEEDTNYIPHPHGGDCIYEYQMPAVVDIRSPRFLHVDLETVGKNPLKRKLHWWTLANVAAFSQGEPFQDIVTGYDGTNTHNPINPAAYILKPLGQAVANILVS